MTSQSGLTLVLVDGNRTSRKGIELLIRSWGHHVVGMADDARSGRELIHSRRPDVTLVDVERVGGAESLWGAPATLGTNLVLLLAQPDRHELDVALASDVCGLVLKSGDPGELRQALYAAGRGERHVAPAVEVLVARSRQQRGNVLSKRQREVLQLLANGMTGEQASRHLMLSPDTVRTHVRDAMRRLGARTRVQAVTMAVSRREIHL